MADFQYHNEALRKARILERKLAAQSGLSGQSGYQQKPYADPDTGIGSTSRASDYRAPEYSGPQSPDFRQTPDYNQEFRTQEFTQEFRTNQLERGQSLTPTGGRPPTRPPSYPTPAVTPSLDILYGTCISPSPTPALSNSRAHTFEDVFGDHEDFQELFDTSLDWKY